MMKKSYLSDSGELIKILKEMKVGEGDLLGTVDVNSLYTSIRQDNALKAVRWALDKKTTSRKKKR